MLLVGSIAGLIVATMLIARELGQTAKNLQLARQAIEEYLTKVSESRLLEEPGLQPLRRNCWSRRLTYYQSLMSQRVDDRGLRSDLGQAHMRVGAIKSLLGEYAEALNAYRTALEIYRDLAPEDSAANRTQTFQADALREMGIQYLALGDAAAAQTHIAQAVAIGERFVQAKPADEERQNRLAGYYLDLGTAQSGTGDLAAAERSFRQSVAIQERIVAAHPDIANRLQGLAKSQSARL